MYKFKDIYQYTKDLDILYVEDDKNLLKETKDILEDFFATVTTAIDGEDGIEKYNLFKKKNNRYYDLVITDINMPRKDGLSLIKDINQINLMQNIIIISAYNESERLIELIHEGISNFIMKPIDFKQLMRAFYKNSQIIYNQKQKNNHLIQQSKFAAMGEMIDSIAHQWLQPINIMKMQTDLLEFQNHDNLLKKNDIELYIKNNSDQIEHLIETLNEFRRFFRTDHKVVSSSYKEMVKSVELLLKDNIIKYTTQLDIQLNDENQIEIVKNEFKHILINIINNALEAFKINEISDRKLIFTSEIENNEIILYIEDNAGGIPENIIGNIFEENFTTKEKGTGVGLYLSSMIIEKINGKISVSNGKNGAIFKISLKNPNK